MNKKFEAPAMNVRFFVTESIVTSSDITAMKNVQAQLAQQASEKHITIKETFSYTF